jgi:hypothetical protein
MRATIQIWILADLVIEFDVICSFLSRYSLPPWSPLGADESPAATLNAPAFKSPTWPGRDRADSPATSITSFPEKDFGRSDSRVKNGHSQRRDGSR